MVPFIKGQNQGDAKKKKLASKCSKISFGKISAIFLQRFFFVCAEIFSHPISVLNPERKRKERQFSSK